MGHNLLDAIDSMCSIMGKNVAEIELKRLLCDEDGVVTVSPKYRVDVLIKEIEATMRDYTIE